MSSMVFQITTSFESFHHDIMAERLIIIDVLCHVFEHVFELITVIEVAQFLPGGVKNGDKKAVRLRDY